MSNTAGKNTEILIIRNNKVPRLYDVALVDFEGETMRYLQQFLSFEQATEQRAEFCKLYGVAEVPFETTEA